MDDDRKEKNMHDNNEYRQGEQPGANFSVERRKRRVLFSLLLTLYSWQMERFSQVMRSLMAKGRPVDSRRVSSMK